MSGELDKARNDKRKKGEEHSQTYDRSLKLIIPQKKARRLAKKKEKLTLALKVREQGGEKMRCR